MEPLAEMQLIAEQRGGNSLSRRYINSKEKLVWECSEGHVWSSTPFSIKVRKSWCPQCAGNQPLGIDAMYKLARDHGGRCLSVEYFNVKTKMLWQCKFGHIFKSSADNINQGRWCPICYRINSKRQG